MNTLHSFARNQKKFWRALLGFIFILSLMTGNLPAAQAQGGTSELFTDAGLADAAQETEAHVMRSRLVNVNFGLLFGPNGEALDASVNPEIALNLFPDASYTGVVDRVEPNYSGGQTWFGTLKETDGLFFLVASEGSFIAHVTSQRGIYEVSRVADNLYKVIQIDQTKLGEDAPGLVDHPDPVLLNKNVDVAADSASTIDVMVVYTTAARKAEGTPRDMNARIDLAMAETKQSYINAGIVTRLRLVHAEEVSYAETGDIVKDLLRVINPSDGILDNIHILRNLYGADMVAFIVNDGGNFCGLSADILAEARTAFQLSVRNCMTGYYTFGHEFGHLQGARHDVYVDPNNTPYTYGHGYVNTAARWRTVMAYNTKCFDRGFNCTRLLYFSNPKKSIEGAPAGQTGTAENYKVLNATALTVANFRKAVIGRSFNSSFDVNTNGWKVVTGNWALSSSGGIKYFTSPGAPGIYSSVQFASSYGDLNYLVRMKRRGCVGCPNTVFIRGNPASLTGKKNWRPAYQFQYNNAGEISVWKVAPGGAITILKDWTASPAVVKGGWNTLKVVAVGKSLRFYVNGTLVYSGVDTSYQVGKVGFGFFRNPSTTGDRLYVDWARLTNTPTGGIPYDE